METTSDSHDLISTEKAVFFFLVNLLQPHEHSYIAAPAPYMRFVLTSNGDSAVLLVSQMEQCFRAVGLWKIRISRTVNLVPFNSMKTDLCIFVS